MTGSVASLGELDEKPLGTKIRVDSVNGGQSWTLERAESGWVTGGIPILPEMLTGYIAAGRVVDMKDAGPLVGEWWMGRSYWYLIRSVSDGQVTTLRWRRGVPTRQPERCLLDANRWHAYTIQHIEPPTDLGTIEVVMLFIELWQEAERRVQVQQTENQTLKNRPDPVPLREQVASARLALDRLAAALTEPF